MAASNYITELDYEAIWDTEIPTARFALIGVRIAEQLNFWINRDATEQITDVRIIPLLEQLSEEILNDIVATSKLNAVTNPWDFIQANVPRVSRRILNNYNILLDEIKILLGKQFHYTETDRYSYNVGEGGLIKRTI